MGTENLNQKGKERISLNMFQLVREARRLCETEMRKYSNIWATVRFEVK